MPVYRDESKNTWYCKFYYEDWNGERRQKMKRGFKLQREAKEWERTFLEEQAGSPDMTFQALFELYLEDISTRLKESSVDVKRRCIEYHIIPCFKDKPINQITPADVRKWQNRLIAGGSKPTMQRNVNNQLNAMLNFAVKYYSLPRNPCSVTGLIGKSTAERMDFWTHDEFKRFISCVKKPHHRALFNLLYYTGMRCGEALALTPADIDLKNESISITKTYHRIERRDVITAPKTPNSIRKITIPTFLCEILQEYIGRIYGIQDTDRIFHFLSGAIEGPMRRASERAGAKRIRVHDIRHSHVSMLIDLGFPAILIAERIGDTVAMVNNTYGHLYPNRHEEVAHKLQQLVSN